MRNKRSLQDVLVDNLPLIIIIIGVGIGFLLGALIYP